MGTIQSIDDGLVAQQALGSSDFYTLNYTDKLAPGDTITASFWSVQTGLVGASQTFTPVTATIKLSGGAAATWYLVSNLATTGAGATLSKSFRIFIQDEATLGTGIVSCFPSLAGAVASLRRDRLVVAARNYMPGVELEDDYILEKLVAEEASLQRELRCFFSPREMLPEGATQSEIDAVTAAGNTVALEAGYDYTPEFFRGDTWGLLETRQRPIIAVHSMQFAYPSPQNSVFAIPPGWFRLDSKYGKINLVPIEVDTALSLNAFLLSAIGGGRTVPLMIQLRYRAGLANAARDYPDLLDVIKKRAVLGIIEDAYNPSSLSDSADGLSQSLSLDVEKLHGAVDRKINTLRQAIHGIQMMVI